MAEKRLNILHTVSEQTTKIATQSKGNGNANSNNNNLEKEEYERNENCGQMNVGTRGRV